MMSIINDILILFGENSELDVSENFEIYVSKHRLTAPRNQDNLAVNLSNLFSLLEHCEIELELLISIEAQDSVRFLTTNIDNIAANVTSLTEKLEMLEDDESVKAEIRVNKDSANFLPIFNLDAFIAHLSALSLEDSFTTWNKLKFRASPSIHVWEECNDFITRSILFKSVYPSDSCILNTNSIEDLRDTFITKRDKCGHFANAAQFEYVPDDFKITEGEPSEKLSKHFRTLFNSLLVIFLSDFTSIEKNKLKYRLKGYKLLSETLEKEALSDEAAIELEEIYKWTYNEGNFADKIGLARNIISIHLLKDTILSVEKGTANSVESGYDLYLKENVKQYIEIKNKISDFLQSQSDKALEITKNMFSMFKTGLWTFTTFFISVFLLRVVSKGSMTGVVSFEVLLIGLLLIGLSFIYLCISISELNSDKKRLLEKYSDIRNRYKDLLDKNDLDKIINEEEVKKIEEKYINKKRKNYSIYWFLTNILLLVVLVTLYYCNNDPSNQKADKINEKITLETTVKENST